MARRCMRIVVTISYGQVAVMCDRASPLANGGSKGNPHAVEIWLHNSHQHLFALTGSSARSLWPPAPPFPSNRYDHAVSASDLRVNLGTRCGNSSLQCRRTSVATAREGLSMQCFVHKQRYSRRRASTRDRFCACQLPASWILFTPMRRQQTASEAHVCLREINLQSNESLRRTAASGCPRLAHTCASADQRGVNRVRVAGIEHRLCPCVPGTSEAMTCAGKHSQLRSNRWRRCPRECSHSICPHRLSSNITCVFAPDPNRRDCGLRTIRADDPSVGGSLLVLVRIQAVFTCQVIFVYPY